jgi:hypothetical protein
MLGPFGGVAFGPPRLAQASEDGGLDEFEESRAEPALQLGDPRPNRGDQAGLLGVGRAQLVDDRSLDRDGRFQMKIGRDRGLHDNSGQARLPMGRTERLPHAPPDSQLVHSAATGS